MSNPTLRLGSRGSSVKELQKLLNEKHQTKLDTDGIFGSGTDRAVKAFQKAQNLGVDGIVGRRTWEALRKASVTKPEASTSTGDSGITSGDTDYSNQATWDTRYTDRRIATLYPGIQAKAIEFVVRMDKEKGIKLRVTSAFRSYEEQAEIYAKGRTAPGKIVSNAKPGSSYHNFGLAIDVVEIRGGKALFSNDKWDEIGAFGESLGWEWGGNFKSITDKPHFQITYGNSTAELRAKNDGKAKSGADVKV